MSDEGERAPVEFPRLLVISGCPPGNDGVGAILERQILEHVPRQLLRVVTFTPRDTAAKRTSENDWVDAHYSRRYEYEYHPLGGLIGESVGWLAHTLLARPHLSRLTSEAVSQGLEHDCEAVLAVLESPTAIFVASEVARRLDKPLYCFVMDGPNIHIRDFGYGRFLKARLLSAFDSAMRRADRIAVAGEAMRNVYEARYGKRGSILRQGLDESQVRPVERVKSDRVMIGFAGSLTARDAFVQLTDELARRQWKLAGRKVIVRIIGAHMWLRPTGPQHLEYFGWRSHDELVNLLSDCDYLYMPQPFHVRDREFAELSFPNKLCTYVPVGRPIVLHAPRTASLHSFFERFPCGPTSSDLDAEKLVNAMEAAEQDDEKYQSYVEAVQRAFVEELNLYQLEKNVQAFLGRDK